MQHEGILEMGGACLTDVVLLGYYVVLLDGAGQTQQLDQPAVVHQQGVDVATGQDLGGTTTWETHIITRNTAGATRSHSYYP